MENEVKYIAKVGNMWVTAVFENAQKVSLSKNVNEAYNVKDCWQWVKDELGATIYSMDVKYKVLS